MKAHNAISKISACPAPDASEAGARLRIRTSHKRMAAKLVAATLVGGVIAPAVLQPGAAHATGIRGTGPSYCTGAQAGGYNLTSFNNVYACGPVPVDGHGDTGPAIPFFWPTTNLGGFQCTELAIRYLYVVSGGADLLVPLSGTWDGSGTNFARAAASTYHLSYAQHIDGYPSSRPSVGDIISEWGPGAQSLGDVGVVTSVSASAITIMAQNNNGSGKNTILVNSATSWSINPGSKYNYRDFGWVHPTPPPPPPPPAPKAIVDRAVAAAPSGYGGYSLAPDGALTPFGGAPAQADQSTHSWPGQDVARGIALTSTTAGYVADFYGGVHAFGGAPDPGDQSSHYWVGHDYARGIAVVPGTSKGYLLDLYGGLHPFGGAPDPGDQSGHYWPGWDAARAVALIPNTTAGYVLDAFGGLHPFGGAPDPGDQSTHYWPNADNARGLALLAGGAGGYVIDLYGGVHPFGNVPSLANQSMFWWPYQDVARGIEVSSDGHAGMVLDYLGNLHPIQFTASGCSTCR